MKYFSLYFYIGLDSTAALELTDVLSKIAGLGMTIVAVVHQPRVEIFRKFDDVLMIVPGGRYAMEMILSF